MDIVFNALCPLEEEASRLDCVPIAPFFQNIIDISGLSASGAAVPLVAKYYGLQGRWIALTPMYWEASHNDSIMTAFGETLDLDEATAQMYFKQCTAFLADDGEAFFYHSPSLWLMKVNKKPLLNSPAPHKVMHTSLMPIIEQWDSSLYWTRLFTEIQMLFASCQFNHVNGSRVAMNGLWFWGDGVLNTSERRVLSNDDTLLECLSPYCETRRFQLDNYFFKENDILAFHSAEKWLGSELRSALAGNDYHCYYNNASKAIKAQPWHKRLWRKFR